MIEMLLTVLILAVLVALGAPSLRSMVSTNATTALQGELISALQFARGEAVTRSETTAICASSNGISCDGATWGDGWLIYVDEDEDGVLDNDEDLLRVHGGSDQLANVTFIASGSSQAQEYLLFNQQGMVERTTDVDSVSTAAFNFCADTDGDANIYARAVIMSVTGRAYRSRDNDDNQIHNGLGGDDLNCCSSGSGTSCD